MGPDFDVLRPAFQWYSKPNITTKREISSSSQVTKLGLAIYIPIHTGSAVGVSASRVQMYRSAALVNITL